MHRPSVEIKVLIAQAGCGNVETFLEGESDGTRSFASDAACRNWIPGNSS
jgi:hypothetical protein